LERGTGRDVCGLGAYGVGVCADKRPPERFRLRFDRAQMAMKAAIVGHGVTDARRRAHR